MKDMNGEEQALLIIRRGGSAELDSPKGGVWKIAYADFMTAMMAFFLVMWLINATSESTKTGVANYFNPIKLSEGTQLPRKGLLDPDQAEPGASDPAGHETPGHSPDSEGRQDATGTEAEPSRAKAARYPEEALFRDPYAVLAAIAAEAEATSGFGAGDRDVPGEERIRGATGELDRIGSEPFRDPFDPPARTATAVSSVVRAMLPGATAYDGEDRAPEPSAPDASHAWGAANGDAAMVVEPAPVAGGAIPRAGKAALDDDADFEDARSGSPRLADRLLESLAEGSGTHSKPNISVVARGDGVLISLSDQVDFGMFAIGSAEPLPETVAAMETIAELLKEMRGNVIIRGHTDGRPFRSEHYDNWRLSSARAQMAYHMLVRGGLDEARVSRIEGHADRDLKLPADPEAAENRRIEILIEDLPS